MIVGEVLQRASERYKEKTALIFEDKKMSFNELYRRVNRFSNGLINLGITKGDRVAIFLPNSLEYVISYLASFNVGALVVPIDITSKKDGVKNILNHAEVSMLITKSSKRLPLAMVKDEAPCLKDIILCESRQDGYLSFDSIIEEASESPLQVKISEKDHCAIFYTSGTTGSPKGILWNYRHLDQSPRFFNLLLPITDRDVKLCAVPFSHAGGLVYIQNCIVYGITIVIMSRFVPSEFLRNVEKYKVTCFHVVPAMFVAFVQLKELEKYDLKSLRWVVVFGAPGSEAILKRFGAYCSKTLLVNGYGLMETAPPNTVCPLDKDKLASVGKPPPWIDIKIVNEDGKAVPIGEVGEVTIKGWVVMEGYYKEPELTARVIKDGWFYTGDLGMIDDDGDLFIVGRKKEVIIVGGLNVYATEVEEALYSHPEVMEAAVIGVPDRMRGEIVKAVIVKKPGRELTSLEIISYCRNKLDNFKVPRVVEFRESLPKTGSGKVAKRLLE